MTHHPSNPHRRPSPTPRSGQRGSVTVVVTIMTVTLIFVAGLVLDGGLMLNARRNAANVAESAARAGAQELDETSARRDNATVIDIDRAVERAHRYLTANGYTGHATATPDSVTVSVQIDQRLMILGIGGLADVTVTGQGAATPVHAITEVTP